MKEVRCVAVIKDDNWSSGPYKIVPYRVLVPESEGGKPEDNVESVLNHVKDDIGYGDLVVTSFLPGLGEQLWSLINWDEAEVVDPTPKDGEEAMELFNSLSCSGRVRELEPMIATEDRCAVVYMNRQPKNSWVNWTDDELIHSPAWLFMYAQQAMKGKLPENLHAAMSMHSFRTPDNPYVKKYFRTRRYKYHCKKNLRTQGAVA